MEKKSYRKPVCETMDIQVATLIAASPVQNIGGNSGFTPGGGSNKPNRAPRRDTWSNGWDDLFS